MVKDMKSVTITLGKGGTFTLRYNVEDKIPEDESVDFTFDSTRQMARSLTRAALHLWDWLDGCMIEEQKRKEGKE